MVIPDGFGPASETLARDYVHWTNNRTVELPVDEMLIGTVRTKATDSYITDSASAATAYSCGIKTYNGAIGIYEDYTPCGTVLEAAKFAGYKTGLVATSRITHATPASYASHTWNRDDEANIAAQLVGVTHPLGPQVDILLGGGRCFFLPQNTTGSCRKDDRDLIPAAKKFGYNVFTDRAGFDKKNLKIPYMGLFASGHMAYEVDRDEAKEPSLTEMSIKALDSLAAATAQSKKGFFIMIEASRIDHAGHANDLPGHMYDSLEYNRAMDAIRAWVKKHSKDSPTLMLSAADHETGGLAIGIQLEGPPDYFWWPESLSKATASTEALTAAAKAYNGTDATGFFKTTIFPRYGIDDATDAEVTAAVAARTSSTQLTKVLRDALTARTGVTWSTGGHTAVDVNLYAYGKGWEQFVGNHENTDIGMAAFKVLGLEVEKRAVEKKLAAETKWREEFVAPPKGTVRRRDVGHLHHHH